MRDPHGPPDHVPEELTRRYGAAAARRVRGRMPWRRARWPGLSADARSRLAAVLVVLLLFAWLPAPAVGVVAVALVVWACWVVAGDRHRRGAAAPR